MGRYLYSIKDKKVVAYIVSHTESETMKTIFKDTNTFLIMGFLLLAMFFFFIYKLLSHRETLQQEVNVKTKKLRVLNKNLEKRVAREVEKNKEAQEKIYKSEKMTALAEVIGNIAHQWRQPLSAISTAASGLKLEHDFGKLTGEKIENAYHVIIDNTQFLSKTIDDFRDFIKDRRVKKTFLLNDTISNFLELCQNEIHDFNLNVNVEIKEQITINGYSNELTQCFLNIFNNSKDALTTVEQNRLIFIKAYTKQDKVIITIKDNGGGIDKDILPRIFEPYFTTKHQAQGTGLGLHITYNLITNGMNGEIVANNITYKYDNKEYKGVEIKLTIPLQ